MKSFLLILVTIFTFIVNDCSALILKAINFRKSVIQTKFFLSTIQKNKIRRYCTANNVPVVSNDKETTKVGLDFLINQTLLYEEEAKNSLASANDSKEVELFRILYLGKNGKISMMMKEMRSLSKEV